MGLLSKIFNYQRKHLKKLHKRALEIDALKDKIAALSDDELKAKTAYFREEIAKGKAADKEEKVILDELLNEAFAVSREAAKRVLKQFPYIVQIMGALVIHEGDVAEMKTGEGKTLTATMAVYLNALLGKGVHVVTVNEYLANRDAEWMGEIYRFLGLTVGVNLREKNSQQKKEAYLCDITYTTNSELGFDYLRDNMVRRLEDKTLRGLNFGVIDEADSILIDESRTPLIISGGSKANANLYVPANRFVRSLTEETHYQIDLKSKSVFLSEEGAAKAERVFGLKNLYDLDNTALVHCINNALKANYAMAKDVDYVVENDEIVIIDSFTGRKLVGRTFSEGLHQAIEAKERVTIKPETTILATITYQNFFRLYNKLAGMTGTAKTEEEEFLETYNMRVIEIPTNLPIARIDDEDMVFKSKAQKYEALIKDVKERHEKGQPVLIGTIAVETSEEIEKMMRRAGLHCEVLNAKNHEREADIVANAGQKGALTIATNMAGRGTDIKLGEGVKELGGLAVIGTERHEARRIDNQLRGRSGRQGDPGFSRFYVSTEDDLMKRFGNIDKIEKIISDDGLQLGTMSWFISSAQKKVEGSNYDARKNLLEYDNVLSLQREKMYRLRDSVLETKDCFAITEKFYDLVAENAVIKNSQYEGKENVVDVDKLINYLENVYLGPNSLTKETFFGLERSQDYVSKIKNLLIEKANARKEIWGEEAYNVILKSILLRCIDMNWPSHIDKMSKLRDGIHLRGYANVNPLVQYKNEGFEMFNQMMEKIANEVVVYTLKVEVTIRKKTEAEETKSSEPESK